MTDKQAPRITLKTAIVGLVLFCYSGFNLFRWYSTGNFYASHNGELAINYHDHPGYFVFLAALNVGAFLLFGVGLLMAAYKSLVSADQAK
ncbi:hypothetical protein JQ604_05065 [Bradyrhizobium jicamae]|uniref:hypothetical protein n=1 Tax=Bradyrhizobium jicamae TaxID=280332 RepID=UPI001BAB60FD|nr:hypothetical protein [Bradyrhizobium jicamae]MBR0751546.1 hypothetical protein [Bradyrhizobium jicamae]